MRYFCTYFDRNYLVKGLSLIDSLDRHEKNPFQIFVVCLDEITRAVLEKLSLPNVTTIPLHEIEQGDYPLLAAKENRTLFEYYWTLTSTIILRILEGYPEIDVLTYLDGDLFFYSSPDPMFEELGEQSILIHEHRFSRAQASLEIYGKYNVGLLCFRNDSNAIEALNWWREKCIEWCYARLEDGKYADQRYLNDWPSRFKHVVVLENIGAGVGPWNHIQYDFSVDSQNNNVMVNDLPLVFYHFHSLAIMDPRIIIPSKYMINLFTKKILRLCFLPYLKSLSLQIEKVHTILPDFHFGLINSNAIDSFQTFLAKEGVNAVLKKASVPQCRIPLDDAWDCYCSEQLNEFSMHITNIEGLIQNKRLQQALSSVSEALTEFPGSADFLSMQAILLNQGSKGREALNELLKAYPNCARIHLYLGDFYLAEGDKDKTSFHYETAARLQPGNVVILRSLADFYYVEMDRIETAMQIYLKIFHFYPKNVEVALILGHISVALQKFDHAITLYERVLELEPWNVEARGNLDKLISAQGGRG